MFLCQLRKIVLNPKPSEYKEVVEIVHHKNNITTSISECVCMCPAGKMDENYINNNISLLQTNKKYYVHIHIEMTTAWSNTQIYVRDANSKKN